MANTITAQVRNNGTNPAPCWLTSASTSSAWGTTSSSTSARSRSRSRPRRRSRSTSRGLRPDQPPVHPGHDRFRPGYHHEQCHPEKPAGRALGLRGPGREPVLQCPRCSNSGRSRTGEGWICEVARHFLQAPSLHGLPRTVRVRLPSAPQGRDRESGLHATSAFSRRPRVRQPAYGGGHRRSRPFPPPCTLGRARRRLGGRPERRSGGQGDAALRHGFPPSATRTARLLASYITPDVPDKLSSRSRRAIEAGQPTFRPDMRRGRAPSFSSPPRRARRSFSLTTDPRVHGAGFMICGGLFVLRFFHLGSFQ